jgi:mono/diheme cytochrome c family protein
MRSVIAIGWVLTLACAAASAQTSQPQEPPPEFTPEQIRAGAALFARSCAPCHGSHMADPEAAFDLRTFPHDQHSRFVESVTKGKNSMPPWGSLLKPEDIEALWAYVVAGEKPAEGNKAQSDKTDAPKADASRPDDSKAEASKPDASKSAKKNPDRGKASDHSEHGP